MSNRVLADNYASITDFKRNPMGILNDSEGFPVSVLNHNKPVFYCISPDHWEAILDKLEDMELSAIAESRKGEKSIKVSLSDL